METIGAVIVTIFVLFVVGGISGSVGWDILEDYDWFRHYIKYSTVCRRTLAFLILSTIGIPFVWGFIVIGCILLIFVSGYEIIRYGHTTS